MRNDPFYTVILKVVSNFIFVPIAIGGLIICGIGILIFRIR